MKHVSRTLALSLSLAAFSFMTNPAFAQDSMAQAADAVKDKAVDMATDKAKDTVKDMAKDKMTDAVKSEMASDAIVDGADKMVKKDWNMDKEMVKETGDVMTAPAVMQKPVSAPVQAIPADTTVETVRIACPEGTTAQDDGTCMITGDYQGE